MLQQSVQQSAGTTIVRSFGTDDSDIFAAQTVDLTGILDRAEWEATAWPLP